MIPSTMEHRIQLTIILLVLMMITTSATQSTFVQYLYKKIELSHNITGTVEAQYTVKSNKECGVRLVKFPYYVNRVFPKLILKNLQNL